MGEFLKLMGYVGGAVGGLAAIAVFLGRGGDLSSLPGLHPRYR